MVVVCVVLLVGEEHAWVAGAFCVRAVLEQQSGVLDALGEFADAFEHARDGFGD
jgi:hypothetical protein